MLSIQIIRRLQASHACSPPPTSL